MDSLPQSELLFEQGRTHFLSGEFFEAHDIWEELWQHLRGADRRYLQGLIQAAVGCYHLSNGNQRGAFSQFCKSLAKIAEYPSPHWGLETATLRRFLKRQIGVLAPETDNNNPRVPRLVDPPPLPYDKRCFPSDLPLVR